MTDSQKSEDNLARIQAICDENERRIAAMQAEKPAERARVKRWQASIQAGLNKIEADLNYLNNLK